MEKCKYKYLPENELRKIKLEFREEIKKNAESCSKTVCTCVGGAIQFITLTDDKNYNGYYVEEEKVMPGEYLNMFGVPRDQIRLKVQESTIFNN